MESQYKLISIFGIIFVLLGCLFIFEVERIGKLRVVFCDVGQGDGILIVSPGGHQAVVDAGDGTKMSECLSENTPFFDRTIELIVPTHPQKDHMGGFLDILSRYQVKKVLTTNIPNDTLFWRQWEKQIAAENAVVFEPDIGNVVVLDPDSESSPRLEVLWPSSSDISKWKSKPVSDLNDTSVVMRLTYGDFCAYLTGDLPKEILEPLVDRPCDVLKVVHHGSKTGTSDRLLEAIAPKVGIIQVGKDNRYNHPDIEVINLLLRHNVKVLRNDILGTVSIQSDGSGFEVLE